jgi:hypothetical protein
MTKRVADCFLASTLIILILVPVWAADKSKDEETLKNAATVLQTMLGSKNVPQTSWRGPIASSFFPM